MKSVASAFYKRKPIKTDRVPAGILKRKKGFFHETENKILKFDNWDR